ncbi:MAG TPA: MdtA/MuxA family multidrug efflux RND transporter periplasmic adaptor subunit [Bryobacteraceae bacterium]|jgi:multidrug efflux system membrane fusion protein|nr:MdtA/MuxA family multidrug efflux RND transporter periplasmic adaptor subunit [Bryobacteraceae bacterium]
MEEQTPSAVPKPRPSGRRWLWIPVVALLGAGAWYLWSKGSTPAASAGAVAKGGKKGAPGVIPVVAAKATKGDIGVYITGLGSVIPIYTVTVKSRVDGQLMTIHYKEGDLVKQNDLLVEIDPRPYQVQLEQAEGQMARDQATLENARVDLDRYQKLLAQNAIPEQQLATQKATVAQDEGVVKSDQGAIDSAKLNLVYCSIRAPITGKVGLRLVDPGNIVHAADTNGLIVITQIQPISVIFTLAEDDLQVVLRKLAAGQHLSAEAWDRANTTKIGTGTLVTVDNQIDPTTGSLRLRADFDNSKNQLFPNQFVNVRLLVEQKRGVTLVPNAVIQRTTNSVFVYLVKSDNTVTVRPITLGVTEGDNTEVTSGLAPGDVVVMTGVDELQEGSHVTVQTADGAAGGQSGGKPQ